MYTCICMWMLFIVVKLWRTRRLHYSRTAESSLGKIARKYCENFSQNLSFSPKFVKFATFFSNRLIFTNFGEKDKFWEKIFSPFFTVLWQSHYSSTCWEVLFRKGDDLKKVSHRGTKGLPLWRHTHAIFSTWGHN